MFQFFTARRVSLLIVAAYALIFWLTAPYSPTEIPKTLLLLTAYFLLPLVCIWYGDELGDYVGMLPGPAINSRTPGWMVKFVGWFLLLLPAIIFLFISRNS